MNYRYSSQRSNEQQNLPLSANYSIKKDKKYTYSQPQVSKVHQQLSQIELLRKQLGEERQRVKILEARTIHQQCTVLNHLQILQAKFQELSIEKDELQQEINQKRGQDEWKSKYQKLQQEHKHIKGIANSMIDMMHKCSGVEGNLHQAWRWIKRNIWEYQGIRKKALQWKQVYDQVGEAISKKEQLNK